MTDIAIVDYRRPDVRNNVLENPFWMTSAMLVGSDVEDKYAVCFSFPTAGQVIRILDICFQVCVAFTASTLIDVGTSTLATDAVTTAGVCTIVDMDDYIAQGSITVGTLGYYFPASSDYLTMKANGTGAVPYTLTGAATAVPCITVSFTNSGTILVGKGRVHALVSILPGL
jgi:hypothetical protein